MSSFGSAVFGIGHFGPDSVTMLGRGRVAMFLPKLFRATKDNQLGDDLSRLMLSGKASLDLDRDGSKMVFDGTMRSAIAARPFVDFVAPFLQLIYEDGSIDCQQVGLYVLIPAGSDYYPGMSQYKLDGRDLLWLLQSDKIASTYNVASGANYVTAAVAVLTGGGLTRVSISPTDKVTSKALSWPPGTSRLQIVNDLMTGCGFYNVWCDRFGVVTSFPFLDLARAEPAVIYTNSNSTIVPPISDSPTLTQLCNRVVVVGGDPAADPVVSIWENTDPTSPASYQRLGNVWISRTIEDSEIRTQTEADALARRYGEEGASYYRKLTLRTRPDPGRNPREIYALDARNPEGDVATGNWWCSGWDLNLDVKNPVMVHELNRVEPYGGAAV